MGVQDVLDEVVRDECFYRNSGGGITVSGGEALAQSEFVANLLAACKREGLHTALDTSGYASWERVRRVLDFVDLVLFDIKHLDPLEHKKGTGVDNRGILENLTRIAEEKPVWLRMPLIAGFNDSEAYVRRVISMAKKIHAEKISFLPYHEGGKSKSEQLGRVYPCPAARAPDGEHIDSLKRIAEEDMKVSVGN